MSLKYKIIAPFLDEKLTMKDLDPEIGFVGMYYGNKNRPWLDNHFFLMYDITKNAKENYKRECRFEKHTNQFNFEIARIKGKFYKIYSFPIINPKVKRFIQDGLPMTNIFDISRIILFWKGTDDKLTKFVFPGHSTRLINSDNKGVPEYDDYKSHEIEYMSYESNLV